MGAVSGELPAARRGAVSCWGLLRRQRGGERKVRKMGFEESVSSETRTFRPYDGPNECFLAQNESWVVVEGKEITNRLLVRLLSRSVCPPNS